MLRALHIFLIFIISLSAVVLTSNVPLVFAQEVGDVEAEFNKLQVAMARFKEEESVALNHEGTDAELRELRKAMDDMKRNYDSKIKEMENKIARLEREKTGGKGLEWGKLEDVGLVSTVAQKEGTNEAEKKKLEKEFESLMGEPRKEAPPGPTYPPTSPERAYPGSLLGRPGAARGILQTYNPDISVIGDFLGTFIHPGKGRGEFNFEEGRWERREFADRLSLREVELGLQAALDPYARGDLFLGIHENRIELEEAYMTLLTLPWGLQAKVGQFKPWFGKYNRVHRPEIFQADFPLINRNLFGEEGARRPGISISWLIPNPWDHYVELTGEFLTLKDSGSLKVSNKFGYLLHLKNFFALTDNSSLEAGVTGFTGNLNEDVNARMEAFDLTYRWKPVTYKLRPYKSFLWQSEVFLTQADNIDQVGQNRVTTNGLPLIDFRQDTWGAYTFAEYQLSRRNYAGLRLDYAKPIHNNNDHEWAISPYWTFWQSDFVRWRLQYTHTQRRLDRLDRGPGSDDMLMLQGTWSMGVHRPHPF